MAARNNSLSPLESGSDAGITPYLAPPTISHPVSSNVSNNLYADGYSIGDGSHYENRSLRTIDKVPSIKPVVNQQDKIWSQIDVLDDVKQMSEQIKSNGSFFSEGFSRSLEKLQSTQMKLLETMNNEQILLSLDNDRNIWESDIKAKDLINKESFDMISNYVSDIRSSLKDVGESMKRVDESSKDLWESSKK